MTYSITIKNLFNNIVKRKNFESNFIIESEKNKNDYHLDEAYYKIILYLASKMACEKNDDVNLYEIVSINNIGYYPLIVDLKIRFTLSPKLKINSEEFDSLTGNILTVTIYNIIDLMNKIFKMFDIRSISTECIENEMLFIPSVFTSFKYELKQGNYGFAEYNIQLRYYYLRFDSLNNPKNELFETIGNIFNNKFVIDTGNKNIVYKDCIFDKLIFVGNNKSFPIYNINNNNNLLFNGCFTVNDCDFVKVDTAEYFRSEYHGLFSVKPESAINKKELYDKLIKETDINFLSEKSSVDSLEKDKISDVNKNIENYFPYFLSLKYCSKNKFVFEKNVEENNLNENEENITFEYNWIMYNTTINGKVVQDYTSEINKAATVRNLIKIIDHKRICNEIYFYKICKIIHDAYSNNNNEAPIEDRDIDRGFEYWFSLILKCLNFNNSKDFDNYHFSKQKEIKKYQTLLDLKIKEELKKIEDHDRNIYRQKYKEEIIQDHISKSSKENKIFDSSQYQFTDLEISKINSNAEKMVYMKKSTNIYKLNNENNEIIKLRKKIDEEGYVLNFLLSVTIKEVSKKSLREIYRDMSQDMVTRDFRSLIFYAKIDNPSKYSIWHKSFYNYHMVNMLCNPTQNNLIALAFYSIFPSEFVFYEKEWFSLMNNSHIWDKGSSQSHDVQKMISSQFIRIISEFIKYEKYKHEIEKNDDTINEQKDEILKNHGINIEQFEHNFEGLKKILNNNQDIITRQLEKFYKEKDFLKNFDHANKIFSVRNGIIQILKSKAIFRSGEPQDYVKADKSSTVEYDPNLTFDSPHVKLFMDWMEKCFVDYTFEEHIRKDGTKKLVEIKNTDLLDYFLVLCSSFLEMGSKDKKLFFFYGPRGNNSKSELIKLFEQTFGNYLCKVPQNIFTEKGNTGGASPEEYRTKNTLLNIIDEVREGTVFLKDKIKKETGGDSRFKRTLFKEGEDVKQTSKIIVSTNAIPIIEDPDEPTIERLCIIPFYTKWDKYAPTDEISKKKERHYERMQDFSIIASKLPPAMLYVFVQYYSRYASYGIDDPPQVVIDVTNEYVTKIDKYWKFISEFIDIGAPTDFINIGELYQKNFKDWYSNFHGRYIPDITNFISSMNPKLEKLRNFETIVNGKDGIWKGFKLKKPLNTSQRSFVNNYNKREDQMEVSSGAIITA